MNILSHRRQRLQSLVIVDRTHSESINRICKGDAFEMAKSGEKFERPELLNLSWRDKIQLHLTAVFVCDHFKSQYHIFHLN